MVRGNSDEPCPRPCAFVGELPAEFVESLGENRPIQSGLGGNVAPRLRQRARRGTRHVDHLEILDRHQAVVLGQMSGELVHRIDTPLDQAAPKTEERLPSFITSA